MTSTNAHTTDRDGEGEPAIAMPFDFSVERAFDRLPTPFAVIDIQGMFRRFNSAFAALVGRTSDGIAGTPWHEIIHPDDHAPCADFIIAAMSGGDDRTLLDIRIVTPDGAIRNVLLGAAMLRSADGRPAAFMGHFQDVTDQNEARQQLRDSELRYRTLFQRIPVALYRTSPDGEILDANLALARLLGYPTIEALKGMNAIEAYVDPSDRERIAAMMTTDAVPVGQESELVRADGIHVWVRDMARAVHDQGRTFYEGALVDVTDRRQAQAELIKRARQQEALAVLGRAGLETTDIEGLLQAALEVVTDFFQPDYAGVLSIEANGELRYRASSDGTDLERYVAPLREQSLAAHTLQTLDPVSIHDIADDPRFLRPLRLAEAGYRGGLTVAIPSGTGVFGVIGAFWRSVGAPGPDAGIFLQSVANVVGAAIVRSRAQQALEQAIQSKDEFMASVSHEVRTPLTVVSGMAHELADRWRTLDPEELDEFVTLIADHSRDMSDLIDDLLVVARADMGNVSISLTEVDLRQAAVTALAGVTQDQEHEVEIVGASSFARADVARVRQILRNLLSNAFRYGGRHIVVSCSRDGDRAVVEVRDDGDGPPDGDVESIFTAYHRAPPSAGQPSSIGLGLTVSRTLAKLMGGNVTCCIDGGTIFKLELPAWG